MGLISFVKKMWPGKKAMKSSPHYTMEDSIKLVLPGVLISLDRGNQLAYPHEVSIYVPRAVFRKSVEEAGKKSSLEVILNSITVVSAPLHDYTGKPPTSGAAKSK